MPPYPVASSSSTTKIIGEVEAVREGLVDQDRFAVELAQDRFRDLPADRLLTGLRGKQVLVIFVESYGRVALTDPDIAPAVTAVLEDGTRRLGAAGWQARSGYLTSPTAGGGSWLAHATLLSGLWIDSQQRYRNLVASDRLTLTGAFRGAGWRTHRGDAGQHLGLAGRQGLPLRRDPRLPITRLRRAGVRVGAGAGSVHAGRDRVG